MKNCTPLGEINVGTGIRVAKFYFTDLGIYNQALARLKSEGFTVGYAFFGAVVHQNVDAVLVDAKRWTTEPKRS